METEEIMDDKAALEDIRNGGQEGKKFLRKRYEKELNDRAKIFSSKKIANNLVQEVFVKLETDSHANSHQKNSIKTWLYRSLDNAIDELALQYIFKGEEGYEQQQGYRVLYNHYVRSVRSYVKVRIPDKDVEDEVEKIFKKFFDNLHSFRQECSIFTWLFRYIVTGVISDYWRKKPQEDDFVPLDENEMDKGYENDESKLILFSQCLKQVEANLEHEGNTELLQCLQAYKWWKQEDYSQEEIAYKVGKTYDATRQWMTKTCLKKLKQYAPLQECGGIFLKMCLEQVKKDLERDATSNAEILACLHAYLLKLNGTSTKDIAVQIGKKSRETSRYLSQCQEQLMQHPSIPKECQEWLSDFG